MKSFILSLNGLSALLTLTNASPIAGRTFSGFPFPNGTSYNPFPIPTGTASLPTGSATFPRSPNCVAGSSDTSINGYTIYGYSQVTPEHSPAAVSKGFASAHQIFSTNFATGSTQGYCADKCQYQMRDERIVSYWAALAGNCFCYGYDALLTNDVLGPAYEINGHPVTDSTFLDKSCGADSNS